MMRRGEIFVNAPDADSSIQVADAHAVRFISLPYAKLLTTLDCESSLPLSGNFGALHAALVRDTGLLALLSAMWAEAEGGSPHGQLWSDGAIFQLLALLARLEQRSPQEMLRGGLAPWQLRRAKEYLSERYSAHVQLTELAATTGLSTFHFARMFKHSLGIAPGAFQRQLRCERAKELLTTTNLTVTEIAASVGYETPQAFARKFRVEVGTSPMAYRRERRS